MLICLGWLGFSNLLACLTLLCKVGLLVLLRKLFPGRNLFHFFRGYHACVILALLNCCICILLFSFFENGVALGLRCCIFGVVFFVNFMDHRRFVPNKRSFQLLCLLQHSFSLGDFKWWLLLHTNVILRLYHCIIDHINLLSLLDSLGLIPLRLRLLCWRIRLTLLRLFHDLLRHTFLRVFPLWATLKTFSRLCVVLWFLFTHDACAAWIYL